MVVKVYQFVLVTAALYILACDLWTAVSCRPGTADQRLGTTAISRGIALPD